MEWEKSSLFKILSLVFGAFLLGGSITSGVILYYQSENYVKKENAINYINGLGKIIYDKNQYIKIDEIENKVKSDGNLIITNKDYIEIKESQKLSLDEIIILKKRLINKNDEIEKLNKYILKINNKTVKSTKEKSYTYKNAMNEFNRDLYFEIDSTNLSNNSLNRVKKIVKKIKDKKNIQIILESYTNEFDINNDNYDNLKQNRLRIIRNLFIKQGYPSYKISIRETNWHYSSNLKKFSQNNKLVGKGIEVKFNSYKE